MRFTISAALLALASSVLAQNPTEGFDAITAPTKGEELSAGGSYTIVWSAAPAKFDAETISIYLMAGESPETLQIQDKPVAKGLTNKAGSYKWSIPSDLGVASTYGFKLVLDSDTTVFQYSFPFKIVGGSGKGDDKGDDKGSDDSGSDDDHSGSDDGTDTSKTPGTKTGEDASQPTKHSNSTASTPTKPTNTGGASKGNPAPTTTTASPGAGAQATAGSIALLGGLALAALAL